MPFIIIRNDITKMKVDAIVNAANTGLAVGGGVCGAIFKAAGVANLQAACDSLAPIQTGDAVITPGFLLPARFIIHTAGPVYRGGGSGEEKQLRSCYRNSLKLAVENKCESIGFPLISSGIYGYPKDEALRVAAGEIQNFLKKHEIKVYLTVFDKTSFAISERLLGEVAGYLDKHYADKRKFAIQQPLDGEPDIFAGISQIQDVLPSPSAQATAVGTGIDALIGNLDEPFSETLLRLIDAKGKTDAEVYRKANLDRKLFSKIRTGKNYTPSKRTAIALAVALELSLVETEDLLERAGYALSHSRKFDVIVEYFIVSGNYDIFEINEVLFQYDQPLLGG